MPGSFTKAYAERLNSACAVEIQEARDRDMLKPGQVQEISVKVFVLELTSHFF